MTDLPELLKAATPGPWRLRAHGNYGNMVEGQSGKRSHATDNGFRPLATFQDCTASEYADEQAANAAANGMLIALAPTLAALVLEARTALDATAAKLDTALETLAEAGDCDKNCLACIDAREVLTDARTTLAKLGDL